MLTFGKRWVEPILKGQKTLTLRKWPKPLVKVDGVYDAKTSRFSRESFAKLRVTGLKQIRIKDIDDQIARRDGYNAADEAKQYWLNQGFPSSKQLWLVEFKVEKR